MRKRMCLWDVFWLVAMLGSVGCHALEEEAFDGDMTEQEFRVAAHESALTCDTATVHFQQGSAGYMGTLDTEIRQKRQYADTSYENATTISVDKNYWRSEQQGLIRFENIFGGGANQLPLDSVVVAASLVLYGVDQSSNTVSVHRMLAGWPEDATWNSMGNGVSTDDTEAAAAPDDTIPSPAADQYHVADVTDSVIAWQAQPGDNRGWVLRNSGSDGFDFATSENGDAALRPELVIEYCVPSGTDPEPCDGVLCDSPPADHCVTADTLRVYDNPGVCDVGDCTYGYSDQPCTQGCSNSACISSTPEVELVLNPYENVSWATFAQYKANFHSHTTNSDGSQSPATVIDEYHSAGYDILAITDHDFITWPWTSYGRDPAALGMLAVRGDEYSRSDHMNAFFAFTNAVSTLENGIPHVAASGGLSHINHPGRERTPAEWAWYIPWFRDYLSLVGLEVFNQGDRYSQDRRLWDNINEHLFPAEERLVWGYSNDDKHTTSHLYRNFQFMLMPELTESALRTAQEEGAFYFCYEPGGSGAARVPRIDAIVVDHAAKTIAITATGYSSISWIGPGTAVVGAGAVFDYSDYLDAPFVRAVLDGPLGDSYTQPFGFDTL